MLAMGNDPTPFPPRPRRSPGCPICGRPPTPDQKPFCSPRCREVDLARWFSGTYRIAAPPDPDEEPGA
jgi:hypothetical protein